MGLEFDHPEGAKYVMRQLYRTGVWAIFSTLDPRVLQYKPGLLMTPELCEELLERTEAGIGRARYAEVRRGPSAVPAHDATRGPASGSRCRRRRARQTAAQSAGVGRRGWPHGPDRRPTAGQPAAAAAATYRARQMLRPRALGGGRVRDATTGPRCCASPRRWPPRPTPNRGRYAEWAVKETGFGVVEHKIIKNEACSLGVIRALRRTRITSARGSIRPPRSSRCPGRPASSWP